MEGTELKRLLQLLVEEKDEQKKKEYEEFLRKEFTEDEDNEDNVLPRH